MIAQLLCSTYGGLFFLVLCFTSASSEEGILRIPFTMIAPAGEEHYLTDEYLTSNSSTAAGDNLLLGSFGRFGGKKKTTHNDQDPGLEKKTSHHHDSAGGAGGHHHHHDVVHIDSYMRGKIGLGDQEFKVIFDTGSDRLWVFGWDIRNHLYFESDDDSSDESDPYDDSSDDEPFTHTFYHQKVKGSTTFEKYKGDNKFSETYEDECGVAGIMAYETATIGGVGMKKFPFGAANNKLVGPRSQHTDFDGIFGLGYTKKGSKSSSYSPLTHLVDSGVLHGNMFSVYRSEDGLTGEIILGGHDKKHLKGKEHKVVINDDETFDGMWVVGADKIEFGKAKLDLKKADDAPAVALVDTGATFLSLPAALLDGEIGNEAISDALDEDGTAAGYVNCNTRDQLPTLTFTLGGKKYHLSGKDYTNPKSTAEDEDKNPFCQLLVDRSEDDSIYFTLGSPFMIKYHTTYYYPTGKKDKAKIGFAEAAHSSANSSKKKKWGFGGK